MEPIRRVKKKSNTSLWIMLALIALIILVMVLLPSCGNRSARKAAAEAEATTLVQAGDKAPDYRVLTDKGAEIGAVWRKQARSGAEYFSVKLDDPSLVAPIHASLVAAEEAGSFNLIWSRGMGRA